MYVTLFQPILQAPNRGRINNTNKMGYGFGFAPVSSMDLRLAFDGVHRRSDLESPRTALDLTVLHGHSLLNQIGGAVICFSPLRLSSKKPLGSRTRTPQINDLIDSALLTTHKHSVILWPQLWSSLQLPAGLEWTVVPFSIQSVASIANEPGVSFGNGKCCDSPFF
jgi:hypothetical protein